ncbi:hypothetical protein [Bacillus sp. S66]|uniref:hypothetical protein n=1 Tax=Bacillus sp. S66 TaxID=1842608 RepID=UPI000EDE23D6|nr:hypothetical protein [Bacillus sp. S66]RKN53560.1 hypothetical protein D7H67_26255 [Bacillus sp. S66]
MQLKEAIEHVLNGNGIVFLGAGFSKGSINIIKKPLGDASELSHYLCDELEIERNKDLGAVSGYFLQSAENEIDLNRRKSSLIKNVQDLFITQSVKEYHKTIVNLPWRRIYTTNYDDVVEFSHVGSINSYTMNSNTKEIIREKSVVHLNGYARNLIPEHLDNEFKLTNRSYLEDDFLRSTSKLAFDHDVKNSKVIVVIGASLDYDLDIQRILYSDNNIKNKTIFIDRDKIISSPIENARKKLIGEVYNIGTEQFALEVQNVKKVFKPTEVQPELKSFERLTNKFNYSYKQLVEADIWSLLINGEINDLLVNSNKENNNYIIQRTMMDTIKKDVKRNDFKIGIIHSNLGNGKTCFVTNLAYQLSDTSNVFIFKEYGENWELEVEKLYNSGEEAFIIIENYQNHLGLIEKIIKMTDNNCKLLLTSRTFVNNSTYYKLEEMLSDEGTIEEYDINHLNPREIKALSEYLQNRKFDKIFKLSSREIEKIIINECDRRISDVLLYIIESKNIRDKIDDIVSPILKSPVKKDILLALIISNACSLELEFDDLIKLLELQSSLNLITRDAEINEFVDIENGKVKLKSAVLSRYIMVSKEMNKDIIKVMEKMIINADKLLEENKTFVIRKLLISISNIREILVQTPKDSEDEINNYILHFFERFTELKEFKGNLFYWLQYAMACIDANQLDRAETYFKNSYQLASNSFNTYQIDTQYGRYLLELGMSKGNKEGGCFDHFKEANGHLKAALVKKPNQAYYVFKQIYLIEEYVGQKINVWDHKEKADALKMCNVLKKEITKRGDKYLKFSRVMDRVIRKIMLSTTVPSL